eukprot:gene26904-32511_t
MDKRKQSVTPAGAGAAKKPTGSIRAAPVLERIKIISMGSGATGKSCLIKRYCEDRVDNSEVRVNFWDLSGHSEFFEIRNEFYKDAQGCMLVYDLSSRESFEECDVWLAEAAKYGLNIREIPIALCANKVDKKRVVSEDEGRAFAQSRGLVYFETSASSGQNVQEMFEILFQTVYRRVKTS